jgi:hypothetical protein
VNGPAPFSVSTRPADCSAAVSVLNSPALEAVQQEQAPISATERISTVNFMESVS